MTLPLRGAILLALILALAAPAAAQTERRAKAPDVRYGITLPQKPEAAKTLPVCRHDEVPGCYASPGEAIKAAPRDDFRILIFCGYYIEDTASLSRRSNVILEGVACKDGGIPVLDARGVATHKIAAYPWLGGTRARDLWVENLDLRGSRAGGIGTPVNIGGSGTVVFRRTVLRENATGILVNTDFDGTLYVIDSVFRDNGYGRAGRTHHLFNACQTGCRTVVLDSFFGRIHQGGDHVRVDGDITAIGNVFIDEPGSESARVIDAVAQACRMRSPDDPLPCQVARNYMLKGKESLNRDFVSLGEFQSEDGVLVGMLLQDNIVLGLRLGSVFVADQQRNARLLITNNLVMMNTTHGCGIDGYNCLVAIQQARVTAERNTVTNDPAALPSGFPNFRRIGPGHHGGG